MVKKNLSIGAYSSERAARIEKSFNPNVPTETHGKYSISPLRSYNSDRHITLDDAESMLKESGLRSNRLKQNVSAGNVDRYTFNGTTYVDRLDIGRVYHTTSKKGDGLTIERYFTKENEHPLDVGPERYADLKITDKDGKIVFEMPQVEIPRGWDEGDLSIVAQKYFMKPTESSWKDKLKEKLGRDHEFSPRHLINRVTNFITDSGWRLGYFATEQDRENFREELAKLQIDRKLAFNSPVQFNAGIYSEYGIPGSEGINYVRDEKTGKIIRVHEGSYVRPQAHACFIKGPRDDLESILQHVVDEGAIFSSGSGIGQNIGSLREDGAPLSSGGRASGPMSFLTVYDRGAGSVKSGGKSRRAARMNTMDEEHPDIMFFVNEKVDADHKCLDLMKAGWTPGMDGEAATTVPYQNTNISVRLSNEFFRKAQAGEKIQLKSVKSGKVLKEIDASELLKRIAFGSWRIGDPGVQYRDTILNMHTTKNSGSIRSSNPCSEYLSPDDTSCNLVSTNLIRFSDEKGNFDVEAYKRANRIGAIGCDILNDSASYPVKDIAQISPEFRTIGVGFAGLGNLLMRKGIAYNSEKGRALTAAITALMTGTVYETSAEMAEKLGTFTQFEINRKNMLEVMRKHQSKLEGIVYEDGSKLDFANCPEPNILEAAKESWNRVIENGSANGFRNAQATVLAPTGTISYLLGCSDSTGIEPSLSLKVLKSLAGGGSIEVKNREVESALNNLGYKSQEISDMMNYISKRNTLIGAPYVRPEHLTVFETALGNNEGLGSIPFEGHVRMLGAAQPWVSGAISKTCNLPESATVKQMHDNYILGKQLGLKAIAMFRKNSKPTAVISHSERGFLELKRGEKEELPSRRGSYEFEVKIGGVPLHLIVGEYPDGRPGQVTFLSYKAGSTLGSLLRSAGIQASASLKRGVKLEDVVKGWIGEQSEPNGMVTGHPYIKTALSPLDFAGKVLALEYLGDTDIISDHSQKVDLTKLRGFENGAFNTIVKNSVDDWNYDAVIADPRLGGFKEHAPGSFGSLIQATEDIKKKINGNGDERGIPCNKCGTPMRQTAPGCFTCTKCGDKVGGCGM